MKQQKYFSGLTLVELMAVVTIIGILAVFSVASLRSAQIRGRDSKRKTDLNIIAQGLESYYANFRTYPGAGSCVKAYSYQATPGQAWIAGLEPYVPPTTSGGKNAPVPIDPTNNSTYTYVYDNCPTTAGKSYHLEARLENSNDPEVPKNGSPIYVIER